MPTRQYPLVTVALCAVVLAAAVIVSRAGPLTPPAGPVSSTYKTLTEIEPRIAINAANTPGDAGSLFKITQPGSYYLTGNITGVTGKDGIDIAVAANGPSVTIDLMGFELVGVPGSQAGIRSTTTNIQNVAIRNGTIRAWGDNGVDILYVRTVLLTDLHALSNGGIGLQVGTGRITGCTAVSNALQGIHANDTCAVSRCTATFNTGDGIDAFINCTVENCTAGYNGGSGISAQESGSVTGCAAERNGVHGITINMGTNAAHCSASLNTANGISAGFDCAVEGCVADSNTSAGISTGDGCIVSGCSIGFNVANGILVGSECRVADNVVNYNGTSPPGSGIYTNGTRSRIEGNQVTNNGFGIYLDSFAGANVIIRNVASGNPSGNYIYPSGGNFIGTLVGNSAGMNAAANSMINISFP